MRRLVGQLVAILTLVAAIACTGDGARMSAGQFREKWRPVSLEECRGGRRYPEWLADAASLRLDVHTLPRTFRGGTFLAPRATNLTAAGALADVVVIGEVRDIRFGAWPATVNDSGYSSTAALRFAVQLAEHQRKCLLRQRSHVATRGQVLPRGSPSRCRCPQLSTGHLERPSSCRS